MDDFSLSSSLKRRELEQIQRKSALKRAQESREREIFEAHSSTASLIEGAVAARRERELKAEVERMKDVGAPDNGVGFERSLVVESGTLNPGTDRVILAGEILGELASNPLVVYPMLFELYAEQTSRRTHCGVLEFSGRKGNIVLSEKVLHCLGLPQGFSGEVRLRYKVLPKCTSVSLRVPTSVFELFPDFRAFLEGSLREQYATLSTEDQLIAGGGVPIIVEKTEPESAVCIVDADITLELNLVDDGGEKWKVGETALVKGQRRLWMAGKINRADQAVRLEASADSFVSFWPLLDANMLSFDKMFGKSEGAIDITFEELKNKGEYVTVGVCGEAEVKSYVVSIENSKSKEECMQCENCNKLIPPQSFAIHTLQCRSLFRFCPDCDKPLEKSVYESHRHCLSCGRAYHSNEEEKHLADWHSDTKCMCGAIVTRASMETHLQTTCYCKPEICRFCQCPFPRGNLSSLDARDRIMGFNQHEAACGNRTDLCRLCHKRERLKDMHFHMQAFHPQ